MLLMSKKDLKKIEHVQPYKTLYKKVLDGLIMEKKK